MMAKDPMTIKNCPSVMRKIQVFPVFTLYMLSPIDEKNHIRKTNEIIKSLAVLLF